MANSRFDSKKRQRKKRIKIICWILVPLISLLVIGAALATYNFQRAANVWDESVQPREEMHKQDDSSQSSDKKNKDLPVENKNPKEDNVSILFLGIDESKSRTMNIQTRTDAMILATFNRKEKSIKMISIPRDTHVYLPNEQRNDKITHAHFYGGVDGAVSSVEELFNIPIDFYVRMNFYAFIDVIDELGGIEVDVPFELYEMDSEDTKNAIHLEKGMQQVNGEEALALARTRKYDNDFERGKRQQKLLKAILKKAISIGAITKLDNVMEAVGRNMVTDMSFSKVVSFYKYISSDGLDIETYELKGYDRWIDKIYYFQPHEDSIERISQDLKIHLGMKK